MMSDDASANDNGAAIGQVVGLLRVITGLLVVIAIVLLVILARGPEDQDRSALPPAVVALATLA
jgi:hypothetical protein